MSKMKAPTCAALLLLCLMFALVPQASRAETAKSLGQVPSLLKTPEAKKVFKEQIEGAPTPDKLGIHLPAGLTAKAIAALLLPAGDKAPLNSVGAKPLPDQPDLYAAIVCTGGDVPTGPADMQCNQFSGSNAKSPLHAHLGVIEMKQGSAPRLVAKPTAVDGMVDWRDTQLPSAPDALDDAKGDAISPQQYDGFDLAPYRISKTERAFGLRGVWSDSYSGGFGSYSALYLFAVVDGALKEILAVPMSAYKDIAGDWHKDGTRSHDITQGANVLIIMKRSTDGYFDLMLKSRTGHWQHLYQWSKAAGAYRPVPVKGTRK
ncbi:MAG: hypothetical protein ACYC5H_14500 [Methylovirgula sp.]